MSTLFGGPLAQAIGWALLHLLWQGVLVAAILAAALALLQRQSANARYLASCGALAILVALSLITGYRAYDPLRVPDPEPLSIRASLMTLPNDAVRVEFSDVKPGRVAVVASFAASHMPQILLVWLIGVTLLSTRLVVGWMAAQRLAARNAQPAAVKWELAMARIADAMHLDRTIRLLESAAVEVPTVIGWLRPVVLLPVASLSGLSTDQIEMVLAHELAHIRRHDFIVNLLQSTVETLFFYQPAVWWISRRIRIEREHCCDDLAVAVSGDPIRYARALTRFEELRIDAAQTILAASGGSLLTRVRRLVGVHGESASWSSRWAAGVSLLFVVVALLVGPTLPVFAKHEDKAKENAAGEKKELKAKSEADAKAAKKKASETVVEVSGTAEESDDPDDVENDTEGDPAMAAVAPEASAEAAAIAMSAMAPMVVSTPMPLINMEAIAPRVRARIAQEMGRTPMAMLSPSGSRKISDEKKLTVDDLIALRSSGVTPSYIEQMRGMGLGNLTLNDLIAMRIHGVTPEYIKGLRDAGIDVTSVDSVVSMRIQGVTGDYIQGMRAAGYDKLSAKELIEMRIQGVTPRYVKEMADTGYRNLSSRELVELRIQGVSADFVKSLAESGYTNLSVRDLVRLRASGVNADFIRELAKYRSKQ